MPKYIGDRRSFYPGIPNGDMEPDAWVKLPADLQSNLVLWGMFDISDMDSVPVVDLDSSELEEEENDGS